MAESLADRMQLCKDRYNDIPQCLIDEVRELGNKMTESLVDNPQITNLIMRLDNSGFSWHKMDYIYMRQWLPEIIGDYRALEAQLEDCTAENAIYKKRPSKPYEENKMGESLTGRLINLFHRCDSTIRLDSISLIDEVRALEDQLIQMEANLAEYKYTPQAYDAMWERVKEVVNENNELKAQLEDCTAVNAEVMKKVARLEKSINNQETDSN